MPISKNKFTFKLLAVSFGLMTACAGAELLIRWLDLPPRPLEPINLRASRISLNPILKFEMVPNYIESDATLSAFDRAWKTNRDGFRDRNFEIEKPPDVYRIIALGDSTTVGNGIVDPNDVYAKRLEQLLNKHSADQRFEVMNLGVGGYETYQEAELLREKGLKYQPDFVLIGFCVNDFDVDSDGQVYENLRKVNPHIDFKDRPVSMSRILLNKSRLAFFVFHRLRGLFPQIGLYDNYKKKYLKGRSTVEAGFDLLKDLQDQYGFKVMVFILPGFDRPFDQYRHFMNHQKLMLTAAHYQGIKVVDFLEKFQAINNDASVFTLDGVHPNVYGHDQLAKMLVRYFTD